MLRSWHQVCVKKDVNAIREITMRNALIGSILMMTGTASFAAAPASPHLAIEATANDAIAQSEIQITPVIVDHAPRYIHAIVTDSAQDVIEIFAI
jgi:hypothetical protein